MSDNTATTNQENIGGVDDGLASSIANLRSILKIESPSADSHNKSLFRGLERITELESQLKEEKALRNKQEESYEALSKYNKELAVQVELLTKSRENMEDKFNNSDRALQAEKAKLEEKQSEWTKATDQLEKEKSENLHEIERLKARNLFFQRQNEELKVFQQQLADLKVELEALKREMAEKEAEAARTRGNLEQRLVETEGNLKEELEAIQDELSGTKREISGTVDSLSSFLSAMKADDDDEGVDDSSSDLDTIVNKVGAAMAEMRTTIVGIQSEKDELVRELDLSRSDNDDVVAELELCLEKWRKTKDELEDLKEDYEDQRYRIDKLERKLGNDGDCEDSYFEKSEEEAGDAPDSPRGRAVDLRSEDSQSPVSERSYEEEARSPSQQQEALEIDSPNAKQDSEPENENSGSPGSRGQEKELSSPAKRRANVLDERKGEEEDADKRDVPLEDDHHESPASPKRLKVDDSDHHGVDI